LLTNDMDPKLYPAFIDEATNILADVRRALLFLAGTSADLSDLQRPADQIRSLIDSATIIGLSEIARISGEINAIFERLDQIDASGRTTEINEALDLIAKLESLLLKASLDDENFSLDIDDFIDQSFGLIETAANPNTLQAPAIDSGKTEDKISDNNDIPAATEGFEIDDDLLEIFAEEADDLLRNIENGLTRLAEDPYDSEALWEIRRNAHTFKGSAGIVGLKQLSEIAHKIEDLLDSMNEAGRISGDGVLKLLQDAATCLRDLVYGNNMPELAERIKDLTARFANAKSDLLVKTPQTIESNLIQPDSEQISATEKIAESAKPIPAIADLFTYNPAERNEISRRPELRSIVRISLSRIDELVGLVREMIIGRSFYEQQIKDFEHQLEELHNTTRRLQATSSKLEIDFEASMLESDLPSITFRNDIGGQTVHNGFDELEFDRYTDFHQNTRELSETAGDAFAVTSALDTVRSNLGAHFEEQRKLVDELQEKLMRIRMVEFGSIATRLQRAVRVTCDEENKNARLNIINEKLEVDTQILDSLIEPLMHLLKNAIVHGIETPEVRRLLGKPETGLVEVTVLNQETHIVLTVSDDGRGISPAALKAKAINVGLLSIEDAAKMSDEEAFDLIFLPGLTTAEKLNLNAGRGVGMSIVKESIESYKGSISVATSPQRGTRFTIRMPLKLAVTRILLVKACGSTLAIPLKQIKRICGPDEQIIETEDGLFIETPSGRVSAIDLGREINANGAAITSHGTIFVIADFDDSEYAIGLDDVLRAEEVVIKPLNRPVSHIREFLGAAIIGNGRLVPVLDIPNFLSSHLNASPHVRNQLNTNVPEKRVCTVMIVDDSPSVRHLTKRIIESAGWRAVCAKDGLDALEQLRSASEQPSILLTDVEMPRMNGYELCSSLKRSEQFSSIPVIMITSRSAEKHQQRAKECGVTRYLTKPFDDSVLVQLIREIALTT